VSAIVSFGMGAGISVGQAVAGYIGPIFGWRLPFIIISVPALFCAVLVYFTVEDPERGAMEHISKKNMTERGENEDGIALVPIKSHRNDNDNQTHINKSNNHCDHIDDNVYREDSGTVKLFHKNNRSIFYWKNQLEAIISLLTTPTVALSLLQGAPGCVPWGIINVFLNDYLSEDRGFSVQAATTILVCFSVGYTLGLVVGGAGGRFLYKIDIRFPALLAGGTYVMVYVCDVLLYAYAMNCSERYYDLPQHGTKYLWNYKGPFLPLRCYSKTPKMLIPPIHGEKQ